MEILVAPIILFLVIVAPIWLILHYRYKSKMSKGLSHEELTDIEDMLATLDKLIDRVETLENILEEEHPSWRKSGTRK